MRILPEPRGGGDDLSGLVWATERYYQVLGSTFLVRSDDRAVGHEVDRLLEPFRCPPSEVGRGRRLSLVSAGGGWALRGLYVDCEPVTRSSSWAHLTAWLLSELNRVALDGYTGFAVHAGVVSTGSEVVAFPARSGEGKSTLSAACLTAGFQYLSDEALCVDFGTRLVVPYPKPLALSAWSRRAVGHLDKRAAEVSGAAVAEDEVAVLAGELGAATARGELHLGHVVRMARTRGEPELHELSRSEALAQLLDLSFNHYKWPRRAFELCTRLARDARAWRLQTGDDPMRAAALLLDHLGMGAVEARPDRRPG